MKTYLAIYTGSEHSMAQARWAKLSEDERHAREQEAMKAWGDWVKANATAIVDIGSPLGKTKAVSPDGVSDIRNAMAAYTIIRAENHDAAARLFENHPHFTIFPGDSVEIMECLPMPG
jgi:hypothetical protein